MTKSVCIVGAGFAGLASARTLTKFGYDVTVYEKAPDVGGVWSRIRRYPGVATQNSKDTYHLSELAMPKEYPDWPSGSQVQSYLQSYVEKFNLQQNINLNTEVVEARQDEQTLRWTVTTRPTNGKGRPQTNAKTTTKTFDVLYVCNGTFSDGFIPPYPGLDEFRAAGGVVEHTCDLHELEDMKGKDVVIVGYGKSACDFAVAVSRVAASTTVVARKLIWKLPKHIAGLCYKYLFLGRVGENLFEYIRPGPVMRMLHGPLKFIRDTMVGSVEWVVSRQLDLVKVGALPPGRFEDIARASISLVSEEFFERIASGKIALKREQEIVSLRANPLGARLSDGSVVPAQIVACGTGFHQRVPFLDSEKVMRGCTDEHGNFLLYRFINPPETKNLFFVGYNSSLFCPTSFEVAALWSIAVLEGSLKLPSPEAQRESAQTEFEWMRERTKGKHSHGTNVVPFSLHNIDDMLKDLSTNISPWALFKQWLLPVDPSAYQHLAEDMLRKRLSVQ